MFGMLSVLADLQRDPTDRAQPATAGGHTGSPAASTARAVCEAAPDCI